MKYNLLCSYYDYHRAIIECINNKIKHVTIFTCFFNSSVHNMELLSILKQYPLTFINGHSGPGETSIIGCEYLKHYAQHEHSDCTILQVKKWHTKMLYFEYKSGNCSIIIGGRNLCNSNTTTDFSMLIKSKAFLWNPVINNYIAIASNLPRLEQYNWERNLSNSETP